MYVRVISGICQEPLETSLNFAIFAAAKSVSARPRHERVAAMAAVNRAATNACAWVNPLVMADRHSY